MSDARSPVVIGATGGSGTRVVVRVLRRAGFFFGTNLNEAEDSQEFPELYDRWANRYVLRKFVPLCREERRLMIRDFARAIRRHRSPMHDEDEPWGWKEPRSIFFLPFLNRYWPGTRFIHVIRDGRDMAFSSNQNQLRKHACSVLAGEVGEAPDPVRSASLWARINTEAASCGEVEMGGRYLRIRFEDLCSNPSEAILKILGFLGVAMSEPSADMIAEVSPPRSMGRWRVEGDRSTIDSIHSAAAPALRRFGYV